MDATVFISFDPNLLCHLKTLESDPILRLERAKRRLLVAFLRERCFSYVVW